MEQWLESVYSDGSSFFVTPAQPGLGDTVRVRIRFYEDAPVQYVYLRTCPNGVERLIRANRTGAAHGLCTYEAVFPMNQNRMHYHFYLVSNGMIYYYTQRGITTYIPDHTHDFVVLADYRQPVWVKGAVFYQIFPERFCNGDPCNDVKNGAYEMDGHRPIHMDWHQKPLQYWQGHCMDFFGGDLQGIRQKIPYLKELGVTALYLNPIFAAPSTHKYDCIDYFHVDSHFGGDEALAELSQTLHENGMRLILDISINHTGMAHRWFNRDGLFFDKSVGAYNNLDAPERAYYFFQPGTKEYLPWAGVASLPTLNYTSSALRDVIYRSSDSVLKKWLKPPYSIDGWRFDVADVFARNNNLQLAHELWPEIRRSIREENPQAYILAEDWGDCAGELQGTMWDSPMNYYGCGRVLRSFAGLVDEFQKRDPVLREINPVMTAQEVEARVLQHLAQLPWVIAQNQFNLIDSHDVARLHNFPEISRDACRGVALLQFLLPGTPSIYYGDEADIGGWTENNEGCRFPMPWDSGFQQGETYRFYRTLSHLKQDSPALGEGGMKFLYAQGRIVALARFDDREAIVAVVSMEEAEREISLPLAAVGARMPESGTDLFGAVLHWRQEWGRNVRLAVPAKGHLLMRCPLL